MRLSGDPIITTAGFVDYLRRWDFDEDRLMALLWSSTWYCPTVEERVDLLSHDEDRAREGFEACRERAARKGPERISSRYDPAVQVDLTEDVFRTAARSASPG